jgi:hypothetical protein
MELESESESDVEQASKEPTEQGHGCCCCCTSRKKMSLPCKPSQGIYLPCCCGEDGKEPPYHVRILFLPMVLNPSCVQVSGFRLHALGSCTHHVNTAMEMEKRASLPLLLCFLLSGTATYCVLCWLPICSLTFSCPPKCHPSFSFALPFQFAVLPVCTLWKGKDIVSGHV